MTTNEAFQELLDSKVIPTNLRSQWAYRFERDKLSTDKIYDALLNHGYNIRINSKWISPDDQYVRSTCESFSQLLLTSKVPSNKKKIWKNRISNCLLSSNKVEEILLEYGYKKVQETSWDNFLDFDPSKRLVAPCSGTFENDHDIVWEENGIYYSVLKGDEYNDTIETALERDKLIEKFNSKERKPIIVDTSNLASQSIEAQSHYAKLGIRKKYSCIAFITNSEKSIYYGNLFKEVLLCSVPVKVFHDIEEAKAWANDFILKPNEKAMHLENSSVWLEEGILHYQFKTKVQTFNAAKKNIENAAALKNMLFEKKVPGILDFRSIEKIEPKVKDLYLKHPDIMNSYSHLAAICDHAMNEDIVSFFKDHNEFTPEIKIFKRYSEALNWIKQVAKK